MKRSLNKIDLGCLWLVLFLLSFINSIEYFGGVVLNFDLLALVFLIFCNVVLGLDNRSFFNDIETLFDMFNDGYVYVYF